MQPGDPLERVVCLTPTYRPSVPQFERAWEGLCEAGVARRRLWGAPVNLARNTLTAEFLSLDQQPWALWLDDDVPFSLAVLRWMVTTAESLPADIYGAAYPKRAWNQGMMWLPLDLTETVTWGEGGRPMRAFWMGAGCLLTSRHALRDITERAPFRWLSYPQPRGKALRGKAIWRSQDLEVEGDWVESGEDQGFALLARELGYELWCDTRLRAWHYGLHAFDAADAFLTLERPRTVEQGQTRPTLP